MNEPAGQHIVAPYAGEPVPRRKLHIRRKLRRAAGAVVGGYQKFIHSSKDIKITGGQFVCLMFALYFVSYWSIPVAGVIGATIVIVALERQ